MQESEDSKPQKRPIIEEAPGPDATAFQWLNSGDAFFEAVMSATAKAQRSVRLEMYIFGDGALGERIRQTLIEALGRGVEVKVLLDGWGSLFLKTSFWTPFSEAGGHFRWFNPLNLNRYVFRNHRKLLVCDESLAIVGGFNMAAEWEGDGINRGWRDIGLEVRGPIARDLAGTFESMYSMAEFRHKRFTRLRKARLRRSVPTPTGRILLSAPGRGQNHFSEAILSDLKTVREVRIIAAYFLPSRVIRRLLTRRSREGCRVRIILAGKSDVPFSQLASRHLYRNLMRSGIEIYEYQAQILHSKLVIFGDIVYVGSANLDRRSLYINYELMLRIPNRNLARTARAVFDEDLSRSRKIELAEWGEARSFWDKLLERWAFLLLTRLDPLIARRQLKNLR